MKPVALVCMPWQLPGYQNVGLSSLKSVLAAKGIRTDIYYFNLEFAEKIGLALYGALAAELRANWVFSVSLFGPCGDGTLDNSWETVKDHPDMRRLVRQLRASAYPGKKLKELAYQTVPRFMDECHRRVDWSQYGIVGFSSVCSLMAALSLARKIKRTHPAVPLIVGGNGVFGGMGHALLKGADWIDYVADGEAEESFPELVENIASGRPGRPVRGISSRVGGKIHLSERAPRVDMKKLPPPNYDDYFEALEKTTLLKKLPRTLCVETTRGCWWAEKHPCKHCSGYTNHDATRYISKSPEQFEKELLHLSRRYRMRDLFLMDDLMGPVHFERIFPRLEKRGEGFRFRVWLRPDMTRRDFERMARAGVSSVYVGVDGLDGTVLKRINRGVGVSENVRVLKWCREFGVSVGWNILYGFPDEQRESYAAMRAVLPAISHLSSPTGILPFRLYRDCQYYRYADRFGIGDVKPEAYYALQYPPSRFDLSKLAFVFSFRRRAGAGDSEKRIGPVKRYVVGWRRAFSDKQTWLRYETHPRGIRFDGRRLSSGERPVLRRQVAEYGLLHKEIYQCCEHEPRSAQEIAARVGDGRRPPEAFLGEVESALSEMRTKGFVLEENRRYMGLALPRGSAFCSR
ncbi:MAG TPA: RiPP maturation radical SAM C-methyltransferase [Elusimicrobiota bacterium]|nr:RiPP maturation radical SAM C-methyltransferase [Elusimicrobiota bacterium]